MHKCVLFLYAWNHTQSFLYMNALYAHINCVMVNGRNINSCLGSGGIVTYCKIVCFNTIRTFKINTFNYYLPRTLPKIVLYSHLSMHSNRTIFTAFVYSAFFISLHLLCRLNRLFVRSKSMYSLLKIWIFQLSFILLNVGKNSQYTYFSFSLISYEKQKIWWSGFVVTIGIGLWVWDDTGRDREEKLVILTNIFVVSRFSNNYLQHIYPHL